MPTAYEKCQMQLKCITPKMQKLKVDADTYITSEEAQSIGQGSSLIKLMDNMRVLVQIYSYQDIFLTTRQLTEIKTDMETTFK